MSPHISVPIMMWYSGTPHWCASWSRNISKFLIKFLLMSALEFLFLTLAQMSFIWVEPFAGTTFCQKNDWTRNLWKTYTCLRIEIEQDPFMGHHGQLNGSPVLCNCFVRLFSFFDSRFLLFLSFLSKRLILCCVCCPWSISGTKLSGDRNSGDGDLGRKGSENENGRDIELVPAVSDNSISIQSIAASWDRIFM